MENVMENFKVNGLFSFTTTDEEGFTRDAGLFSEELELFEDGLSELQAF